MSLSGASRQYGIPYSTLRDRVNGLKGTGKPGPPPTFSQKEGIATVEYPENQPVDLKFDSVYEMSK